MMEDPYISVSSAMFPRWYDVRSAPALGLSPYWWSVVSVLVERLGGEVVLTSADFISIDGELTAAIDSSGELTLRHRA